MPLYELDDRSITGHADIDRMHAEIAQLSQDLAERIKNQADFAEIRRVFLQLQATLREHFDLEERHILALPQNDEVRTHLRKHVENHNQFRDLLTYGEEQFEKHCDDGKVPNVLGLIPREYFEELKNIDRELGLLFVKYDYEKSKPN